MQNEEILSKLFGFVKQNKLVCVLLFGGIVLLGYGLIHLLLSSKSSQPIQFTTDTQTSSKASDDDSTAIVVDVEGAVQKPGVYHLQAESRVNELIERSGGLTANADMIWVQKSLNLAKKLVDGEKVYVPQQEGEAESINSIRSIKGNNEETGSLGNLIDINSASESELDSLPGVGTVTAQKIIAGRPYSAIEELVEKKAVGQSVFEKIKDRVTAY